MNKTLFSICICLCLYCSIIHAQETNKLNAPTVCPHLINKDSVEIITTNTVDVIYKIRDNYIADTLYISYKKGYFHKSEYILRIKQPIKFIKIEEYLWEVINTNLYPYIALNRLK